LNGEETKEKKEKPMSILIMEAFKHGFMKWDTSTRFHKNQINNFFISMPQTNTMNAGNLFFKKVSMAGNYILQACKRMAGNCTGLIRAHSSPKRSLFSLW
jgi:hypothetical protein